MSGEFDSSDHEVLRTAFADALERLLPGTHRDLVVDMSDVTFIDAGTIGVLLEACDWATKRNLRLRITGTVGIVRRVIQISGAWERLSGRDDDAAATPRGWLRTQPGLGPGSSRADPAGQDLPRVPRPGRGSDGDGVQPEQLETADELLLAKDYVRRQAGLHQDIIDAEVSATRRAILNDLRTHLRNNHRALTDDDFLAVADTGVVLDAIILAATMVGGADACDLQVYDPGAKTLKIIRSRGFTDEFLTRFATIEAGESTACALAVATGEPVIIDDVSRSPIFANRPSLAVMLTAGSHAVQSHPLADGDGRPIGVLSFHYGAVKPRRGQPELVGWWAARALGRTLSS